MWAGRVSAGHVVVLAEHLSLNPMSRCRMIRHGGDLRWIGWDMKAEVTAAHHDLFVTLIHGLGGSEPSPNDRFPRPGTKHEPTSTVEGDLFAPSIADFSVGKFMNKINGG